MKLFLNFGKTSIQVTIALNHKSQKSDRIQKQQDSNRTFSIINNNNKTAIALG
jgi:hypothetical protein